jgi:hypothetical protein
MYIFHVYNEHVSCTLLPINTAPDGETALAQIIETSDNRFFRVTDAAGLDHVWNGIEVKRSKGAWVPKAKAREQIVRKAASRIVEAA